MYLLFHKEECPYCAKVRQFMSDEGISYVSIVSKGGSPSRKILNQLGGKEQVASTPNLRQLACRRKMLCLI